MEKILMDGATISLIILAFVGLVKIPFAKFVKPKHPKLFRALLTILTLALIPAGVFINQVYVYAVDLYTYNTLYLLFTVATGVFVTYNGIYEGFGVKKLFALFLEKLKELASRTSDNKLAKIINKVGLVKINSIINSLTKSEQIAEVKVEETEVTKIVELK